MFRWPSVNFAAATLYLLSGIVIANPVLAQAPANPPSSHCHVTDGTFTTCPDGSPEWSDVQPIPFPSTNSFLYVNQDAGHANLYLMYDFPFRKTQLGPTDAVQITFDTVEQKSGGPSLVVYNISLFGNGTMQVLQQGQPTPAGKIVGIAGFGASPNSSTPHVLAELQVPLTAGPPSTYSPDPLYWSASVPPTPPPPPCPTQPGKSFDDCTKKYASIAGTVLTIGGGAAATGGGICSATTALTCAPAEVPLLIGGFISLSVGYLLDKYVYGDPAGQLISIPPDPNYTSIATPPTFSVSIPTTGMTPQEVAAFNAWVAALENAIAYGEAGVTSIARAEGAAAANQPIWVTKQTQEAQSYGSQMGTIISSLPQLQANFAAALQAAGAQFTFTSNDVNTFLAQINPASPASEQQQEFQAALQILTQLGFDATDQSFILQLIFSLDPQAVAALGTGVFPQALTDPSINTALIQVGGSLVQNQPSTATLSQNFSATIAGDYVASGIGLRGKTSGNIAISGIPAGATIVQAFLYWAYLDNGEDPVLPNLNVNGNAVIGSLIGSGPDTCWGDTNSFTFRSDVTSLITGNGTYSLTGVASGGAILAEGASLVVIYQLAGLPTKTIIIDDGNLSMPSGTNSGAAGFSGFTASSPATATTTFVVGDGQGLQFGSTPTTFTGTSGTLNIPNLFDALEGSYWDTANINVSSVFSSPVAQVTTTETATANITITGDCLLWSAQIFSITSQPSTSPVVATVGLVEAGANGNTVVNLNGGLNNPPTIQDEIQFVVQFRTIQDPTTNGPALTTQLVNGLVNDGVIPPGEAASITSAVNQNLVVPVGQPTLSGVVQSSSVVSPGVVKVTVQLTNTGAGPSTNTQISQLVTKTLTGSGTVTLNSQTTLPLALPNLAVGASTTVNLFFNVPSTVKRFSLTESGVIDDTLSRLFSFSTSQTVFQ